MPLMKVVNSLEDLPQVVEGLVQGQAQLLFCFRVNQHLVKITIWEKFETEVYYKE